MIKKRKKIILFSSLFVVVFAFGYILSVFFNVYAVGKFRTMQDRISVTEEVDLTGLREIQASGGDLPRFPTLNWRLRKVKLNTIIINAESIPDDYVKGLPSFVFRYNKKEPDWKHYVRRLLLTGTLGIRPEAIFPESEEVKKYGFDYKNLVIGSRFSAKDKDIDAIVAFFDNLPKDTWVHVHCKHGLGRTSMILVMLDIMKNAPTVTLKNIVRRQNLLGSVDLFDTSVWGGVYTKEMLENRKEFIIKFYAFISQRKAGGIQVWSDWNHQYKENIVKVKE